MTPTELIQRYNITEDDFDNYSSEDETVAMVRIDGIRKLNRFQSGCTFRGIPIVYHYSSAINNIKYELDRTSLLFWEILKYTIPFTESEILREIYKIKLDNPEK